MTNPSNVYLRNKRGNPDIVLRIKKKTYLPVNLYNPEHG